MPEAQQARLENPYHKDAFVYDAEADTCTCPEGQVLRFGSLKVYRDQPERPASRVYRGKPATCRACPAFDTCTTNQRHGRTLEIGPDDAVLRRHRAWMTTPDARAHSRRRTSLPEPVFGILNEHQAARRLLLRGLAHVRAEWTLLATACTLRTLARCWQAGSLVPHHLALAGPR